MKNILAVIVLVTGGCAATGRVDFSFLTDPPGKERAEQPPQMQQQVLMGYDPRRAASPYK